MLVAAMCHYYIIMLVIAARHQYHHALPLIAAGLSDGPLALQVVQGLQRLQNESGGGRGALQTAPL